MKVCYHSQTDALSIWLAAHEIASADKIAPGIILSRNELGDAVCIDILDVKSKYGSIPTFIAQESDWRNPNFLAARALISSILFGGILAIPACSVVRGPSFAPLPLSLWGIYAVVAHIFFHWRTLKPISDTYPEGAPSIIGGWLGGGLFVAFVVTMLLLLVLSFFPFWSHSDKVCAAIVAFFASQSCIFWLMLRSGPPPMYRH
jgi:Protein of unknown function (DUF2283)